MIHQPKYRAQFRELSGRNFQLKFLMWKQTKFRQCSRVSLLFGHSHRCLALLAIDYVVKTPEGWSVLRVLFVLLILDSQPSEELSGVVSERPAVIDYLSNPIYFSLCSKLSISIFASQHVSWTSCTPWHVFIKDHAPVWLFEAPAPSKTTSYHLLLTYLYHDHARRNRCRETLAQSRLQSWRRFVLLVLLLITDSNSSRPYLWSDYIYPSFRWHRCKKGIVTDCRRLLFFVWRWCQVYHVDIGSLEVKFEQFEEPVTCLSLCEQSSRVGGHLSPQDSIWLKLQKLAGVAAQGYVSLPGDSKLEYISKPLSAQEAPHTRFNDGACDSKSRFFAGTLYSPVHNIPGRLYRYDPTDKTCVVVDPGPFTVHNCKSPAL